MRLAQLARKTGVRSADIVQFLSSGITTIADEANAKLSDEQVAAVIQHFAPGLVLAEPTADSAPEPAAEKIVPPVTDETFNVAEIQVETLQAEHTSSESLPVQLPVTEEVVSVSVLQPEVVSSTVDDSGEVELIKAPKVSLSGLKVLGKIELPQPRKKEATTEGQEPAAVTSEGEQPAPQRVDRKPRAERNQQQSRRNRNDDRPRKNPVALQREREAQEAEEKRKEELKREKEKRTQHYQQRVKPASPVRAMRLYDEPTETEVKTVRPEPKTWIGKFWRWFRS